MGGGHSSQQGEKGSKGDTGAPGSKGDTGAPGSKGDTGAPGSKGDTGAPGSKGSIGPIGLKGLKGEVGPPTCDPTCQAGVASKLVNDSPFLNKVTSVWSSSFAHDYLTTSLADATYVSKDNTSKFLTTDTASVAYLKVIDAQKDYIAKSQLTFDPSGDPKQIYTAQMVDSKFIKKSDLVKASSGSVDNNQIYTAAKVKELFYLKTEIDSLFLKNTDIKDTYLKQDDAKETYLKKSGAASTYATKTDLKTYLNEDNAKKTFLTISDASKDYVTQTTAAEYETKFHAGNTYRTTTDADDLYVLKTTATDYATKGTKLKKGKCTPIVSEKYSNSYKHWNEMDRLGTTNCPDDTFPTDWNMIDGKVHLTCCELNIPAA
jgi:hypothetical protein